jgi:ribosomal protein S2
MKIINEQKFNNLENYYNKTQLEKLEINTYNWNRLQRFIKGIQNKNGKFLFITLYPEFFPFIEEIAIKTKNEIMGPKWVSGFFTNKKQINDITLNNKNTINKFKYVGGETPTTIILFGEHSGILNEANKLNISTIVFSDSDKAPKNCNYWFYIPFYNNNIGILSNSLIKIFKRS